MFCKRNATYRGLIASFSVLLSGLAGCATMSNLRQSMLSPGVVRSAPLTQRLPSEREALSGRKSDGLTSVAAFLARTSAYQLPSSSAAYVPKRPSIEAMISETTSPENDQLSQVPSPAVDADVRRRELRSVVVANTTAAIDSPVRREPTLALPIVRAVTVSYRPALESTIKSDPVIKPTGNTANQPLAMREPKPEWTIDGVIGWLEQQAARSGDLDGVWPLKFAQLAFHRDSQAAEMPESLPAVTRRILGALMRLVPEIRGVIRDESTPANEALKRVDEMRRMLADRSDPVVSKIALCRKVVTFGVYEEIAPSELVFGRENQAIVYSEIRNLRATLTEEGRYVSTLATRLEVLTADGQSMWRQEQPEIVDESRIRRTDFFVAERIVLPATLPAGDYVLKVMVQDKISQRMHESSMPFAIVSTQKVAGISSVSRIP